MKLTGVMLAATAMALAATAGQAQEKTLKIGALVTLSGAGAAWGQGMLNAVKLAAADVNKDGGLKVGGDRYKVEVISYDDGYKANEAVTAANRLVYDDKVKYIIGTVGSAPILAIQPITDKNKVITMTLAFTPKAISPEHPYTFRPNPTTAEVAVPQINWLVKHLKLKTVGALYPNDETGQSIAHGLEKAYGDAGVKMTNEFFERNRVDFVPLLTRLMANGVDAIELNGNSPVTAGQIVQQARDLGFTGYIIRTGGPATPNIVKVAGKQATEGMYVHSAFNPKDKAEAGYEARYVKTFHQPMNGFSPFFYDGTKMLFEAMQNAGTVTNTVEVKDALEKIHDFKGVTGTLSWTGQKVYGIAHQLDAPFYIAKVHNGQEEIVAKCTTKGCQ